MVIWTVLGVFTLAYAIVSQSLMYERATFSYDWLLKMFERTYWPMFGEVGNALAEFGNFKSRIEN